MPERHAQNAPGAWYVDTRCIDCSAARTVAPGLIVAKGGQSVFARQPETPDEIMMAWRARLLCPTASVRSATASPPPEGAFPEKMTENVFRLGYNAKSSYGAHSFLVRRQAGNLMIDAPRWTGAAVSAIEAWGGLSDILLTHRDDVADARRYAERFNARVSIHEKDAVAAPYAGNLLRGQRPVRLAADLLAIPLAGHTEGSVAYLWDGRCLFTGDSLSWSVAEGDLVAFRDFCWFSWTEQRRSLERLLDYRFEWVFAGHGGSCHLPPEEMHARLGALLELMKQAA